MVAKVSSCEVKDLVAGFECNRQYWSAQAMQWLKSADNKLTEAQSELEETVLVAAANGWSVKEIVASCSWSRSKVEGILRRDPERAAKVPRRQAQVDTRGS